jgi:phosphatidate phosphatase LPIN
VITSHSGLIAALSLEILLKRPDEFKIAELSEIRALFGVKCSSCDQVNGESVTPFYAGFGNRPTDTKSYKRVGEITLLHFRVRNFAPFSSPHRR